MGERYFNCPFCGGKHKVGSKCSKRYSNEANKFYKSKEWKLKREEILERDHHLCIRCLMKYGKTTTDNLEIHHIKKLQQYWEERLNSNNMITLCTTCHRQIDTMNDGQLDFSWEPLKENENNFEFY